MQPARDLENVHVALVEKSLPASDLECGLSYFTNLALRYVKY